MPPSLSTLINRVPYDFSNYLIQATTPVPLTLTQVSEIKWSQSLTPGFLRGTSPINLGRSTGQYEASGSLTIYVEEWELLRNALEAAPPLGGGYMQKSFTLTVIRWAIGALTIKDVLYGVRFTNEEDGGTSGGDVAMVSLQFNIMEIESNGKRAVRKRPGLL